MLLRLLFVRNDVQDDLDQTGVEDKLSDTSDILVQGMDRRREHTRVSFGADVAIATYAAEVVRGQSAK
jgi:hypothetical protein